METKELQKKCSIIVSKIDRKYSVTRDTYLSFVQFMEEVGELAKEINKPKLRNKEIDKQNLKGEFADVFLQLIILAEIFNIDMEDSVEDKIKVLVERHELK